MRVLCKRKVLFSILAAVMVFSIVFALLLPSTLGVKAATEENVIYYDFTNQDTLDSLKPYFQQAAGSGTGVEEEFSKHWQVDGEGVLSRINDLGGGMDTSFAMLHFDRQFQNFEISYKMRAANTTMGWVGIMFGKSAYSTTMIGDGNAVFFNANNGGAFFQGQTLGGNGDAGNNVIMTGEQYYPGDWNEVVIKVYGSAGESANQKVELWVNGNKMLESNKAVAPVRGNVCLFTTAIAADFKDVSFKYLNENGEYSNFVPADSVTIAETATEVYIGDKVALNTTILPENATTRELIFSSSDLSVAIVSQKGEVTFINEGTVTISVSVLDAEEATDTITFNVAAKLSKIEISNKITSANVGDIFTCKVNIVPGDYVTELEFTSTDPDIATVTADGKVTFHKSGTVTIKVRSKEFAGIVDTMTVTVAGESSADNGGDGLPAAAVIGIVCGAVVLVGAAAIVTVMIVKRRKK